MSRKADLEKFIRESYNIISEYQTIIQTSSDPREATRNRRRVDEQWDFIKGYWDEYKRLKIENIPSDIIEIVQGFDNGSTVTSISPFAHPLDKEIRQVAKFEQLLDHLGDDHGDYKAVLSLFHIFLSSVSQPLMRKNSSYLQDQRVQILDYLNQLAESIDLELDKSLLV